MRHSVGRCMMWTLWYMSDANSAGWKMTAANVAFSGFSRGLYLNNRIGAKPRRSQRLHVNAAAVAVFLQRHYLLLLASFFNAQSHDNHLVDDNFCARFCLILDEHAIHCPIVSHSRGKTGVRVLLQRGKTKVDEIFVQWVNVSNF